MAFLVIWLQRRQWHQFPCGSPPPFVVSVFFCAFACHLATNLSFVFSPRHHGIANLKEVVEKSETKRRNMHTHTQKWKVMKNINSIARHIVLQALTIDCCGFMLRYCVSEKLEWEIESVTTVLNFLPRIPICLSIDCDTYANHLSTISIKPMKKREEKSFEIYCGRDEKRWATIRTDQTLHNSPTITCRRPLPAITTAEWKLLKRPMQCNVCTHIRNLVPVSRLYRLPMELSMLDAVAHIQMFTMHRISMPIAYSSHTHSLANTYSVLLHGRVSIICTHIP